ncbi:MAG TPA: CBS domain-containing protein [Pilimelia sp.]|nr:CBS domain-containing protein [Pilimelia sp.]
MRVGDIMSRPVHTVHPTDAVEQAAALLADKNITAAPVVGAGGVLVGMVSDGDLLWHRVPADPTGHLWRAAGEHGGERPKTVAEVMSGDPVTTWPEADVADVAEVMLERDVRSLPVVDDGELVGIVSRRDILRTVVRTDDVLCREVQHRLDAYAGGVRRWTATVTDGTATIEGDFDDEVERKVVSVMARTVPGVAAAHIAAPPE